MNNPVISSPSGSSNSQKRWYKNHNLLVALLVVGIIAVVGVALYLNREEKTEPPAAATTNSTLQAMYDGRFDASKPEAEKRLKDAFEATSNKNDQIVLLRALVDNVLAQKKYQQAVDYAEQAIDLGDDSSNTFWQLGQAYEGSGDTGKALGAYEDSLRALEKANEAKLDPYFETRKATIQEKINEMKTKS